MLLPKPRPKLLLDRVLKREKDSNWRKVRRIVLERDGYRCRVCRRKKAVDVHHVIFRSLGGKDEAKNLIAVCKVCHEGIHGHVIRLRWKDDQQPERTMWFEFAE